MRNNYVQWFGSFLQIFTETPYYQWFQNLMLIFETCANKGFQKNYRTIDVTMLI